MAARKLVSVLSYRVAMRRNSLILWKKVLDEMAPFVDLGVIRDGLGAASVGRDDSQGAALIELEAKPVVVWSGLLM
jgi:hypothetical protein